MNQQRTPDSAENRQPNEPPASKPEPDTELTGDEIRERMAVIRTDIEEHSDEVMAHTEALSDWRFYVRRYPWFSVTAAAAIGFAIVPGRRKSGEEDSSQPGNKQPAVFGTKEIRSALAGAAQRAAMTYASKKLDDALGRFIADDGDA